MELAKYKACICEGAAENAIMDILLDKELLVFSREEMLEESVIRCRDGKKFEQKYLRKGFAEKISVIRILDSRRERPDSRVFLYRNENKENKVQRTKVLKCHHGIYV